MYCRGGVSPPEKVENPQTRRTPDEGSPSFFAKAKKFTLSCVGGRIIMGLLAPNPRKFFEKNLTKNFQKGYVLGCYPKYVR